jgi:hypothetical protein
MLRGMRNLKLILTTNPNYTFTDDGRVFNERYDRELKPYVSHTTGYLYVTLKHADGRYRPTSLHRIVAKLFVPNPEHLPFVHHIDHNKQNPHYTNLEWTTNQINVQKAYDAGITPKGEGRYNNVNPVENIHQVCELLQEGLFNMKEIEEITGVNSKTVGQIRYRKQWKDISSAYEW